MSSSSVTLTNTSLTQNTATYTGSGITQPIGGVYAASVDTSLVIVNSILWGNGGFDFYVSAEYPNVFSITYSNIGGWSGGTNNLSIDPVFISTTDYHLSSISPMIDAGDFSSQYNDPDGTRNDMGAYYYQSNN